MPTRRSPVGPQRPHGGLNSQPRSCGPLPRIAPHVAAIVFWARALGQAHKGNARAAETEIDKLRAALNDTRAAGNAYWTRQVEILLTEAQAWCLAANGDAGEALTRLRAAADDEDSIEKLPVTPGPIVPARKQLGELLLAKQRYAEALREFRSALANAPRLPARCDCSRKKTGGVVKCQLAARGVVILV